MTQTLRDMLDALLVGAPLPGRPPLALREIADSGRPRVAAARGHRDEVRARRRTAGWPRGRATGGGTSWRRRCGFADEPVWAQVPPGNARGVRAFLAAGYRPVGAEALLSATARSADCSGSRS